MADKLKASGSCTYSQQSTTDLSAVLDASPPVKEHDPTRPYLGEAPPAHWCDLARAGYFDEQPKSRLQELTDRITDSISSVQDTFKKKPVPWICWGSVPTLRKEWFFLKGEQCMPLGANRWERFPEDVQNLLTTGSDMLYGRHQGFIADLNNEEQQQVFLTSRLGCATEIVGFDPKLWAPTFEECPDSELLKEGKAKCREGYVISFANERTLVEEYAHTRWWNREEKPSLRVVLMVEETLQSAVEVHSHELASPEYVLRVHNEHGLPVLGFKKHELEKHVVREMRLRFEEIWLGKGHACYIVDGTEVGADEQLKTLLKRQKTPPVDVKVLYLTDKQQKLKSEGGATIIHGQFADLAMTGYFNNWRSRTPTPAGQACCVVS